MIVDKIIPIDELDQNLTHGMKIMIDQQNYGEDALKTAYEILRGYPGNRQLKIEVILDNGMRVNWSPQKSGLKSTISCVLDCVSCLAIVRWR